jgi:Mg2+ and Co2+ transporter CorA
VSDEDDPLADTHPRRRSADWEMVDRMGRLSQAYRDMLRQIRDNETAAQREWLGLHTENQEILKRLEHLEAVYNRYKGQIGLLSILASGFIVLFEFFRDWIVAHLK